jgi:hypothetical protein
MREARFARLLRETSDSPKCLHDTYLCVEQCASGRATVNARQRYVCQYLDFDPWRYVRSKTLKGVVHTTRNKSANLLRRASKYRLSSLDSFITRGKFRQIRSMSNFDSRIIFASCKPGSKPLRVVPRVIANGVTLTSPTSPGGVNGNGFCLLRAAQRFFNRCRKSSGAYGTGDRLFLFTIVTFRYRSLGIFGF